MTMRYLVTGGAGYVGSHVVLDLIDRGHEVEVIDNLSTGHRQALPQGVRLHQVDLIHNQTEVLGILGAGNWDGVFHFAALSQVGESMQDPFLYLRHNYLSALNIIEATVAAGVRRFVFSSTAALFGGGNRHDPIAVDAPVTPGSPYGESKHMIERVLRWADEVHGLKSACLRYFNAAGADPVGRAGEDHSPETHIIPRAIDAAMGRISRLKLFGTDYPTRDGSCVRDYIHVTDLADAHVRVMEFLDSESVTYNVGTGQGHTNLEVFKTVEKVTGLKIGWETAERRGGDPASLVADPSKLMSDLGWEARYSSLEQIIETAYNWRRKHPNGYAS